MRNLTRTLAVVSLLIPASAYPLGIGEIKLHSALNQNLDAEITLFLSAGENPEDVKVSLASPDKFDENSVPWNYFLSKLKFQTIPANGRQVVVKITSKEVLKEPFLDFLLQVSWPKGDLFREFTLLADPVDEYAQASAPVYRPPLGQTDYSEYHEASSRRRPPPPVVQQPEKSRVKVRADATSGRYGPTGRSDTLWKIAQSISQDTGIDVEQVMIALYDANPGAFYKANINALSAGKTLKIPVREEMLKLAKSDAAYEYNRQMQAWANPGSVPRIAKAVQEEAETQNQLTLAAPSQEPIAETPVSPVARSTEAPAPSDKPNAASGDAAGEEIKAKIAVLEKQLAAMQELIALKDQQLQVLQNSNKSQGASKPEPTPAVAPSPVVSATQTPPENPAGLPANAQPQPPATVQNPTEKPVATPKPETAPPPPVPAKPPVQNVVKPPVQPQESFSWTYAGFGVLGFAVLGALAWYWQQKRKNDYLDLFESNNALGKPNKANLFDDVEKSGEKPTDSGSSDNLFVSDFNSGEFDVFDMDQAEIDPLSEADVYLAYGRYQQAEDLMRHAIVEQPGRDEFKLKLLEIFYANENKQAFEKYTTELIDEGKIDDVAFWAKVTEMGTEICPESIFFADKSNTTESRKVSTVSSKRSISIDAIDEEETGTKNDDLDFDLTSFEELFYNEDSDSSAQGMFDLKATTESIAKVIETEADPSLEPKGNNESLEFDFSALSFGKSDLQEKEPSDAFVGILTDAPDSQEEDVVLEMPQMAEKPKLADEPSIMDLGDISGFDFKLEGPETLSTDEDLSLLSQKETSEIGMLDFDFSSIEGGLPETEQLAKVEFEPLSTDLVTADTPKPLGKVGDDPKTKLYQEESLSIDIDFNHPNLGFTDQQRIDSFGIADLKEMDQMETKLDLAVAYIEMGDREAAVEIAQEVFEKGTPEQKVIAKAIIENH